MTTDTEALICDCPAKNMPFGRCCKLEPLTALRAAFESTVSEWGWNTYRNKAGDYATISTNGAWAGYQAGHAAAKSETAAAGISDAAVQALESIAAMTFDRWGEGYRAGQIAIATLDKLRVQTTEWGPAPVGNEADEPMSLADRLDLMADAQAAGSTAQSDLYAAATVWRKHLRGQPAPTQADSAPGDEAQRGACPTRRGEGRAIMTTNTEALSRDEWKRRYAARIAAVTGWDRASADAAAEAVPDEYIGDYDSPEEAADDEMGHWENDGDD